VHCARKWSPLPPTGRVVCACKLLIAMRFYALLTPLLSLFSSPAAPLPLTFSQLHQLHTRFKRTTNMRSVYYAALLCYVALTEARSEPFPVRKLATTITASDGTSANLELSKRVVAARQYKYSNTSKAQRKRTSFWTRDDSTSDSCPAYAVLLSKPARDNPS
jgi:hypothetical protein